MNISLVRFSTAFLCLRLLASVPAIWSVYRHVLRPDWEVQWNQGADVLHTYIRFWIWESPDDFEHGEVVGIRWGNSLFHFAVNLFGAFVAWWMPVPFDASRRHPNKVTQADESKTRPLG